MKKKLESDVLDLETALEHANAANSEIQVRIGVGDSTGACQCCQLRDSGEDLELT